MNLFNLEVMSVSYQKSFQLTDCTFNFTSAQADVSFQNKSLQFFILVNASIQMQIRLYSHFNTIRRVVHSLQMFTSFKSLPTSLSYDLGIRHVAQKLFFSFCSLKCFQCHQKPVGGHVFLPSLHLLDVSGESAGL